MESGETIGSQPFAYAIDGGTNTTALAEKVPTTTTPVAVSGRSVVLANPLDPHRIMTLFCGGTDAPGERFVLRVTRWFIVTGADAPLYLPETALIAYPTLGWGLYTVAALGAVGNYFADEITLEAAQGAVKRVVGARQPMRLDIEVGQAAHLEIEIERQTAATADVLYRWGWVHREARTRQLDGAFA